MASESDAFHTTQWTVVLAARGESAEARDALSDLCQTYYHPVVAFLHREGRQEEAARELAHGFFEWLLSAPRMDSLKRKRWRFRSYLAGALKHYLSHQREHARRLKRGGGLVAHVAISPETDTSAGIDPADPWTLAPDAEFDRQWALHLLRKALDALRGEWVLAGKLEEFDALQPFLAGEGAKGALAALANEDGVNENTLRSTLHRMRSAYRKQIKAQITPTLDHDGELANEMQALLAALANG